MRVAIVDYGMGNLSSVKNALAAVGTDAHVVRSAGELGDAHAIVLPGVGAFGKGMEGLRERRLVDALSHEVLEKKRPILGICLGLQLLAAHGTELGAHQGLGWIDGTVDRFELTPPLRVPHVGWNDVRGKGRLFTGIPEEASFYFVHSFHFKPASRQVISGTTEYGETIVAAIEHENIFAVQFHPEKSHRHGLQLLKNFLDIVRGS